ncbi:MAG TPA: type II toxin-antitoxin system HicA family toxin [Candidatus Bathyarchaeia archaeon]|nr:type II toxin-antitoxin system HicA family toxin [Candidatus Bathyarchaeia archaeon]
MSRSRLPVLSWRDVLKALQKSGFTPVRQRGSHILLSNNGNLVTVPRHDEIKPGTLLNIIDQAKLSKEKFLELVG